MTDADWVRFTESATRTRDALLVGLDPYRDRREAARVLRQYRESVLGAWAAYRPDGPLPGEVLPSEVARLQRSAT
jgi:hypothetical protein